MQTIEDIKKILDMEDPPLVSGEMLMIPCEEVTDKELGEQIANKLFEKITKYPYLVGLSANQIGIYQKVAAVKAAEPFYFINPKLVKGEGNFVYLETCASIPFPVRTQRFSIIEISSDNHEEILYWDVSYIKPDKVMEDVRVMEVTCIQQIIDTLNNVLILEKRYQPEPFRNELKFGRNDIVKIYKDNEQKEIKFKKFPEFEKKGFKLVV